MENQALNSSESKVIALFMKSFGEKPTFVTKLPGAGSGRQYFRIFDSKAKTFVATYNECKKENETFIAIDRVLGECGINVPEIFAVSDDLKCYLQQDLGDTSLLKMLDSPQRLSLASKVLTQLVPLQALDPNIWKGAVAEPEFSLRLIMSDLHYFKFCFLKPSGVDFDENLLEDEFEVLASRLASKDGIPYGFMYRDFQSRNIMLCDDTPYFIDFQSARLGPVVYDLVSFIWQAKARFSAEEKEYLTTIYLDKLSEYFKFDSSEIRNIINMFALFRTLQVLGAYGFRGVIERKQHFLESIPEALKNLSYLSEVNKENGLPYLETLAKILEQHFLDKSDENRKSHNKNSKQEKSFVKDLSSSPLVVYVKSFSYKKDGYPEGIEDNGGGFVFDCRAMHNPGKYEKYKNLTGKDPEVIEFLESSGEINLFVDKAFKIVVPSIRRYLERDFNSLQVNFGCTGGRHRSVRSAELFAEKIQKVFPGLKIDLRHLQFPD